MNDTKPVDVSIKLLPVSQALSNNNSFLKGILDKTGKNKLAWLLTGKSSKKLSWEPCLFIKLCVER
ncbi:MAG: hypothetical protein NTV01_02205 [Bacteroidia bacterium]|nr:hypothetical protein [Bacteroidia bacterium]